MAKRTAISSADFFQRQENARRSTRRLVIWFALGVAGTAFLIHLILLALTWNDGSLTQRLADGYWSAARADTSLFYRIDPVMFVCVLAGMFLFVGGISFCKLLSFGAATGADTAEALGGSEVRVGAAGTPQEQRLVNVVQEMALASGVPVPRIFVLTKESSINAFAAGMSTGTAAVAVSRGALEKLSRDELQAVIGHEFSHILNGDMRLNMRLVGWIFGLVAISTLGSIVMRLAHFMPARGRDDKGAGVAAAVFMFGLGLAFLIIGWLSSIFAQIIQAAISRERERLADASSAQFTRNPQALANALSRIGGDAEGSKISAPRAQEFAHLFFASGVASLFATHPPLEERIRALDPQWNGKFLPPLTKREAYSQKNSDSAAGANGNSAAARLPLPRRRTLRRAFAAENAVPAFVFESSKSTADAKTLIYLLLMTDSPAHNVAQARILLAREDAAMFEKLKNDFGSPQMRAFPPQKRIAAVLLAAPALRALDSRERAEFCETLEMLAAADANITIYEICILAAVRGLLSAETENNLSGAEIAPALEIVLNLFLKICGLPRERHAETLAAALAPQKGLPRNLRVRDAENFAAVRDAFAKLRCANILVRERAIAAARAIVAADGTETPEERDLLNALAVAVDCPLGE